MIERASSTPRPAAGLLLGALAAGGCGSSEVLVVPWPDFVDEVGSVFFAVHDGSARATVVAAEVEGEAARLELAAPLASSGVIYAIGDRYTLQAHGLGPGPVAAAPVDAGRPFMPDEVLVFDPERAEGRWRPSGLPAELQRFRFESQIPLSRCAELRKVAEYPYSELVPEGSRIPALIALDDERLLALPAMGQRATVLTVTGSRSVDLGVAANPRTARSMYRAPDGELFIGGYAGLLYRGRVETGFRLETTLEAPPREDELRDHPASVRGMDGSRDPGQPLEIFAATYASFHRVKPQVEHLYERPPDGNGRQVGNVTWIAPGRVLFTLDDERRLYEWRNGDRRVALATVDVGGLAWVPGFGAIAVTWDGRMHQYDPETGVFSVIAEGVTARITSITGDGRRIFVLSEDALLDQYVPGEPLCPRVAGGTGSFARVVVFGRRLAKTGAQGVELYEILAPD